MTLLNDSFVDFEDIPSLSLEGGGAQDSDNVLLCHTDLMQCCNAVQDNVDVALGEWYYPNGTVVAYDSMGATFRRNRGQSVVRLWRRDNPPERGRFHCEIPNAANINQNIYVNICKLSKTTLAMQGM